MPKYVGSHDDVISTRAGHVVKFRAGKESWVPDNPDVIRAVRAAGHEPVVEKKVVQPPVEPEAKRPTKPTPKASTE